MEQLTAILNNLNNNKNEYSANLYRYLGDLRLTKNEEAHFSATILPNVYHLCEKGAIRKDLVYLSLLAGKNFALLGAITKYDESIFKLNIEDPLSLFDYCVYKNRHWLHEIVDRPDEYRKLKYCKSLHNKLLMIKFVEMTNSPKIDCRQLSVLSQHINVEYFDEFWSYYLCEMKRLIHIVNVCIGIADDRNECEIFSFACKNGLLDTLSYCVNLKMTTHWDVILRQIYEFESHNADIFLGFTILTSIYNIVIKCNQQQRPINATVDGISNRLMNLENPHLQIELLENIFALLFNRDEKFICREKEIRLILFLLKRVIDEVKLTNKYGKSTEDYRRFQRLSKYLADALWRLELVSSVKVAEKTDTDLLGYMLAPPNSLIKMCLKRGDHTRAYQVVEIFNLRKTNINRVICFSKKWHDFRETLRKTFEMKKTHTVPINEVVENFFKTNSIQINDDVVEQVLLDKAEKYPYVNHFKGNNEHFMNLFDVAITQPSTWEECDILLKLANDNCNLESNVKSYYGKFTKQMQNLLKEIGKTYNKSIATILTTPTFPLNLSAYEHETKFYESLLKFYDEFNHQINDNGTGSFNKNHPSHKTLLRINEICNKYLYHSGISENLQYLQRTINYLQAFFRILYIQENSSDIISQGKNTSYFALLNNNRSELTGKLLFERHLDPSEFEKFFGRLKLDFLYHIVGNCFPTINLHVQENVTLDELYHDNMLYVPTKTIITYIQKRNWLLAFILNEMYKIDDVRMDVSEVRLQAFFNYLKLAKIQHLKVLFDDNAIVAALQNCMNSQKIRLYLAEQIIQPDLASITSSHASHSSSEESVETGQELREDLVTTNWQGLYDLLESVPECQMKKKSELVQSRDSIIVNLIQDCFEPEFYKYSHFICDRDLRLDTILNNFKQWPGKFCLDVIKCEFTQFTNVFNAKLAELHDWVPEIELCDNLTDLFDLNPWYKCFEFCDRCPEDAIIKIAKTYQVDILIKFIEAFTPNDSILQNIEIDYVNKIIEAGTPLEKVKKLLDCLPFNHTINICNNLLTILKKLSYLQFIADYLNTNVNDDIFLKRVHVSLKILSTFSLMEQEQLYPLVLEPLNIIEVLIMNMKLDKLANVLDVLNLDKIEYDNSVISTEKVDRLLRQYAEKSLDFRVITQPKQRLLQVSEHKLMQSFDSLNCLPDKKFVMPDMVPHKDDWVQNDEILECMCCHQAGFSMFNRRHHCRRCGRVVCYNCSQKRMLVSTYGDIHVRVCIDCYDQTTVHSERSDAPSMRSWSHEFWLLNDDPEHNKIIREEFSYEHAPSVSLCLSLLKYHSQTEEHPKFLLEQCDALLKLLQPSQEPIHEIDYLLVVKMLRSLATAAKVLSAEYMLNSGTFVADQLLSQAELLGLLAERGCLNLMPVSNASYLEPSVLRRLRDKLLQREQWTLALEVSTKAGMDNGGVFAAWGKSYLKAGRLMMARDKFQRCFDKTNLFETVSINYSSNIDSKSRLSLNTSNATDSRCDNKPGKDPPLLFEIIQILETKTKTIHPNLLKCLTEFNEAANSPNQKSLNIQNEPALSILNKIKNLQQITLGNYCNVSNKIVDNTTNSRPIIERIFYDECLYYLGKYGTQLSLLEFMVKHGNVEEALNFLLDNRLSAEIFVEIYVKCLKGGITGILQQSLLKIDPSLDVWNNYLMQICRYLERQNLLNSLYQLQLFMNDYVRATMTCIKFYEENATSFGELSRRVYFLQQAEEHLEQIEKQDQWVQIATDGESSSEPSFEEKPISNLDLVLKIDTRLVDRHVRTIKYQIKLVSYLAMRESAATNKIVETLAALMGNPPSVVVAAAAIPTLFGSYFDKICLTALVILAGSDVADGFPLALKIIDEFKLKPIKVYSLAGKQLAKTERYSSIQQLVNCIKSTGNDDPAIADMLDEILLLAIHTLIKANVTGTKVEDLIKLIKDRGLKISAYIEAKQIKTAYFLAVRYKRISDVRRVQREAELLNMTSIKALCQKVLQNYSQSSSNSKEK